MKGASAVWADLKLKFVATNRRRLLRRCLVDEQHCTQQKLGEVNACCADSAGEARLRRFLLLCSSFPSPPKKEIKKRKMLAECTQCKNTPVYQACRSISFNLPTLIYRSSLYLSLYRFIINNKKKQARLSVSSLSLSLSQDPYCPEGDI
jgi:hypothetical protein